MAGRRPYMVVVLKDQEVIAVEEYRGTISVAGDIVAEHRGDRGVLFTLGTKSNWIKEGQVLPGTVSRR